MSALPVRKRLAFFSPLPPNRSGIAAYSRDLLPHLARHATITLFTPDPGAVDPTLRAAFAIEPLAAYPRLYSAFDLALFQVGNSHHHAPFYPLLRRYSGVVVLHDLSLHHFMATQQYARELGFALGAREAVALRWSGAPVDPAGQALNERVLAASLGLVVHSRFAAGRVRAKRPNLPLSLLPQPMPIPQTEATPGDHPLTLAVAGHITPAKQIDRVLGAFGRLPKPQARLHLIGSAAGVDVAALIATLPPAARQRVRYTGYLPDPADFTAALNAADIVVNLREPTVGETSAAALRALALGKPLIVTDHGWYAELPDDVALKVPPGDDAALDRVLAQLLDANLRRRMGAAGRRLIRQQHDPATVAARLAAFLDKIIDGA